MKTTYLRYNSKYKGILQIFFLFLTSLLLALSFPKHAISDDIDIYGLVSVPIEPNVMIIFDTSGSMGTADVIAEEYNPERIYRGVTSSATFNTDDIFYQTATSTSLTSWTNFSMKAGNIICPEAKEELINNRIWLGLLTTSGNNKSACATSGTRNRWVTGNYRNYLSMPKRTREAVAKEAIANLINETENVRFGLFRFNGNDGGRLLRPCGSTKAEVLSSLNAITSSGNTPLGKTLAEVGLYFAGMQSWYQTNVRYTSPIQYRCQKNYVIYMTDGEPTQDTDSKMWTRAYINGDLISTVSNKTSHLDDVALYLYTKDVNPSMPDRQYIMTYPIGFMIGLDLLQRTANNGGGVYYTANNAGALSKAFQEIMSNISEQNASFVSPVIPLDQQNNIYAGNSIYMGFFRPQQSGVWNGNIKKYGLDSAGNVIDRNGATATDAVGRFLPTAQSYWSSSADGSNVAAGGAGERLAARSTPRNIYTYMGQQNSLTDSTNNFAVTNNLIQPAILDVTTDVQRNSLIGTARAETSQWPLRDILHSDPVVVHYPSDSYIFVGSNSGMMHCFRDSDGAEMWGYIPTDLLPNLDLLNAGQHHYFVDGTPVVYNGGTAQKILFFGERRGGSHYTALDITNPVAPSFLYTIGPDYLGGGSAALGQSWSKPEIRKIRTATDIDTVFILPGGYDINNDLDNPAALDTVGRAIFSVRVSDGSVSSLSVHAGNFPQMTHSILDISTFDYNGYGYIDKAYAGDMAGNVFALREISRGSWETRKLFSSSAVDGINKKIFYAPDAVKELDGETIFFTTGDRESPFQADTENRMYSIKNDWTDIDSFVTITESDLVDVTDNLIQLGTPAQKAQALEDLNNSKGWFIRLEDSGEKGVSSPVVFGGVVYYTTYTPVSGDGTPTEDPCLVTGSTGIARLYALDYKTGAAVLDLSDESEADRDGNVVPLGKKDRSTILGSSIPSAPVIAITEGGPKLYVGVEGGISVEDPLVSPKVNIYYWRQILN